jgi:hypothetical protein
MLVLNLCLGADKLVIFFTRSTGGVLAGTLAGLLGNDPRPVFAGAGLLTLLPAAVAWFAVLRRETRPAGVLAGTGVPAAGR